MMRFLAVLILFCGVAFSPAHRASAQAEFVGWVGLHAPDRVGWLENENQIEGLCRGAPDLEVCRAELLEPIIDTFSLYTGPGLSFPRVGELLVESAPGRGISAQFLATGSDAPIPFVPDVYLQDWGYGPYFHQTIIQREGEWFQLPPGPWETEVWLTRGGRSSSPSLLYVRAGDIIELNEQGMYVVSAGADTLTMRAEQPADSWCKEGDPPPLVAAQPVSYARGELLDAMGHLLVRPKYLKGC